MDRVSSVAQMGKNPPAMQETQVQSLVEKIHWSWAWQSTPVSCLQNPMDRGAWRATVRGLAKSQA